LLVHPSVLVGFVRMMRNFMIENARLTKTTSGRHSKQTKLYDYITSQAHFRKIQEKIAKKKKLEDLQRNEEAHVKKTWNARKNLIIDWFELDRDDEEIINGIIQQDQVAEQIKENTFEESNEGSD